MVAETFRPELRLVFGNEQQQQTVLKRVLSVPQDARQEKKSIERFFQKSQKQSNNYFKYLVG